MFPGIVWKNQQASSSLEGVSPLNVIPTVELLLYGDATRLPRCVHPSVMKDTPLSSDVKASLGDASYVTL